jgi:hypothetical protein
MINRDRKRARYLRDALPVRLAGWAADLAQRTLLSVQAKKWSDMVLAYSGILADRSAEAS